MSIARRMELPFRIRFDECGRDGRVRDSVLLRYAQEAAWVHSESAGFDRHWYAARGLTWLVCGAELGVEEPLQQGESISVSTEVMEWRRVWARRHSDFAAPGAGVRAWARVDWVLMGPSGMPARIPDAIMGFFEDVPVVPFRPVRVKLGAVPENARTRRFTVQERDLDPLVHVNNATYLDYAVESLTAGGSAGPTAMPRRWVIEYARAAEPGDEIAARTWQDADGSVRYLLSGADGSDLFRALLKTPS